MKIVLCKGALLLLLLLSVSIFKSHRLNLRLQTYRKEERSINCLNFAFWKDKSKEILTHLQKAQALLQHFPPVKLYQSICKRLASRMLDHFPSPAATTLLLESSSVTLRHLFLTNFHRQLR